MAKAAATAPTRSSARTRGRWIAFAIYYGIVVAICAAAAVQISQQVFFASSPPSPFATCREGLRALNAAVDRARKAAGPEGEDSEDRAIGRFRSALDPEWTYRDGIAASCKTSADDQRALDAIERLRYAEEHAVRREAGELAPLRRRVQGIIERDLAMERRSPAPDHSKSADTPQ
jgi:hypothetical protein